MQVTGFLLKNGSKDRHEADAKSLPDLTFSKSTYQRDNKGKTESEKTMHSGHGGARPEAGTVEGENTDTQKVGEGILNG